MSDNASEPAPGSNEGFTVFLFAIVSVAALVIYIPWITSMIHALIESRNAAPAASTSSNNSSRRRSRDDDSDPIKGLKNRVAIIFKTVLVFVREPALIQEGFKGLVAQPGLTFSLYLPRFLKFILRPKILVLWVWVLLFTSVTYTSLTYNPYAVLGLPNDAPLETVRRTYRSLTRRYHPDQNKTEAARVIYAGVKKAYSAIVNKDEFEDDIMNSGEISTSVALPTFMLNKQNESYVLFGMLALILGVPLFIFLKFSGKDDNKLPELLQQIRGTRPVVKSFLNQLRIPQDPKYLEKQASSGEILHVLKQHRLAPAEASEGTVAAFPLFPDFVSRCQDPSRYGGAMKGLGFDENGLAQLKEWATTSGSGSIEAYEAARRAFLGDATDASTAAAKFVPQEAASPSRYHALRYLLSLHVESILNSIDELQRMLPNEVPSARKIGSLHDQLIETLDNVFERPMTSGEKLNPRHVQQLIVFPQDLDTALEQLVPDIEKIIRKQYRQYYEQQLGGKKELKKAQRQQETYMRQQQMSRQQMMMAQQEGEYE